MDSPLLEQGLCPSCSGVIAGADLHRQCIECLGSDHTATNLGPLATCSACRLIPQLSRRQWLVQFGDCYVSPVEDPELDVVEMEDHEEVPFVFAMPADRADCLGEYIMAEHGAFKDLSRESAISVSTPHGQSFPSRESTTALSLGPHS